MRKSSVDTDYSAVGMIVVALISIQIGAAVAVGLFSEVGAGGAVFLRTLTGAAILLLLWRPGFRLRGRALCLTLLFGASLAGVNLCFYESIDRIPLGTAVTLEFIGPLTVALITSRRRLDWLWAGLAAIGILLLTGGIGSSLDPIGVAFALAAAFFWGCYVLIGKRVGANSYGGEGLAVAMAFSTLLLAPIGISAGGLSLLTPHVLLVGAVVGVLAAAIPFSLELESMRRLPSNVFGVMMSIEPAIAAMIGLLLLGQAIEASKLVAILLVVVASAGALRTSHTELKVEP